MDLDICWLWQSMRILSLKKCDKPVMAAKILVNKVSSIFGLSGLLSKRGRNFEPKIIEQLYKPLYIKKVFTCPYSPKSDLMCKCFNKILIHVLGTLSEEMTQDRHQYVLLVGVYNSTQHVSCCFNPFELMLGRNCCLSVDKYWGTYLLEIEYCDVGEYVSNLKERMEFVHSLGKQHFAMGKKVRRNPNQNNMTRRNPYWNL